VVLKSITKVPNQKVAKCFSSLSSDRLVQICMTHDGFCTKQQHFPLSSAVVMLYFQSQVCFIGKVVLLPLLPLGDWPLATENV